MRIFINEEKLLGDHATQKTEEKIAAVVSELATPSSQLR